MENVIDGMGWGECETLCRTIGVYVSCTTKYSILLNSLGFSRYTVVTRVVCEVLDKNWPICLIFYTSSSSSHTSAYLSMSGVKHICLLTS